MEDKYKSILIALTFLLFFPLFYLFIPIFIAYFINVFVILIASYYIWQRGEKRLAIVGLLFLTFNTFFLIKYIQNLQLLITLDPVEYARISSIGLVIATFMEYLPLLLIFLAIFGLVYAWNFVFTRGSGQHKFAIIFGYLGIIVTILLIALDLFVFSPKTQNPIDQVFELIFWGKTILFPFNLYYFLQIAVWLMSGFTFIVGLLTHLASGGGE